MSIIEEDAVNSVGATERGGLNGRFLPIHSTTRYGDIIRAVQGKILMKIRQPERVNPRVVMYGWREALVEKKLAVWAEVDLHRLVSNDWSSTGHATDADLNLHISTPAMDGTVTLYLSQGNGMCVDLAPEYCLSAVTRSPRMLPTRTHDMRVIFSKRSATVGQLVHAAQLLLEPFSEQKGFYATHGNGAIIDMSLTLAEVHYRLDTESIIIVPPRHWTEPSVIRDDTASYLAHRMGIIACNICSNIAIRLRTKMSKSTIFTRDCGHSSHLDCVASLAGIGEKTVFRVAPRRSPVTNRTQLILSPTPLTTAQNAGVSGAHARRPEPSPSNSI